MTYIDRLVAATTPRLEYLCECGHDSIQWGPEYERPRVNAMRPIAFKHVMAERLAEIERPFISLRRMWRKVQGKMADAIRHSVDEMYWFKNWSKP